jgi:3-oxoacyl-(acyl-carrier-protein) synthase
MNNSLLPKILNLETPDVQEMNYVKGKNVLVEIPYFLKNSFGFGGVNVSVVIGKFKL